MDITDRLREYMDHLRELMDRMKDITDHPGIIITNITDRRMSASRRTRMC